MSWETFQDDAFNLTQKEINALSRKTMAFYTEARKAVEKDIEKLYLKYLTGVKPEDYYNVVIQRDILQKTLAQITSDYRAWSKAAGRMVSNASKLGMSNVYYRKLYAMQWLAPVNFGYLPKSLIDLTTYSTERAWKNVKKDIALKYGGLANYTSKAGTLSGFLVNNRQKEIKSIQQAIVSGLQQGKSYTAMANDIKGIIGKDFVKDGVLNVSGAKANAMRIIRTESNRTMNAGSYADSQFAKDQGIDIERRILSVLDNITRRQSATMDGQPEDKDGYFHYPGGVKALYPGTTGLPKYDANDRESVIDIVDGQEPQIRRGRNPETGKNEVFEYKSFDKWAKEKDLKTNIYGEYVQK